MNIPDKANNVDTYEAPEFNEFKNEVQNTILSSNQALASSSTQLKQALARYASNGASFTENGSANAYNLIAIGNNDILTTYRDGDCFTFIAGNVNTGSSTLSINGLGTRTIKKNGFANDLSGGEIQAGSVYLVFYSLSQDFFELVSFGQSALTGIVLQEYDMTNAGANDLNNIDITWLSAWDSFDYVEAVISDAKCSNTGQMAWALSSDSGATWESFDGSTYESLGWSDTNFGGNANQVFDARMRMVINSVKKTTECIDYSAYLEGVNPNDSDNGKLGYAFNYSGTILTGATQGNRWDGWYTGSTGLNGYLLRFTHEVGNFTSGTLKLIGYKYP